MALNRWICTCCAALLLSSPAWAQKPIVYPAKGQSATQQSKDDGECYVWAKQNSGYDPAAGASAPPPSSAPEPRGGVLRGAAAGAAVGAIGDNDVGEAAGKGAVVGGVVQAGRRRRQRNEEAAQQQQYAQTQQSQYAGYARAYSACMSGRGYTVN